MSVGMEITNADGTVVLNTNRTFSRLVGTLFVVRDFSGTLSMPDFDDTKGAFVLYPNVIKFSSTFPFPTVVDSHPDASSAFVNITSSMPTLFWDNTLKTLTVTAATPPPPVASNFFNHVPDYNIVFIHYK